MGRSEAEVIVHEQVTFSLNPSTTGFKTPQTLESLGHRGVITQVKARLDTGGTITQFDLYIGDVSLSAMTSTPKDEHLFYKNLDVAATASATAASIEDNVMLDGGAFYYVTELGNLAVGLNVDSVSGAGASTLYVDIWARVQG